MVKLRCLVCGSIDLRADRALSGRLICTSCGNPYGVRKVGGNKLMNNNSVVFNHKKLLFIFLLIFVFMIIII